MLEQQPLETLQDIKRIMERSSRFISLSGWSGIAAGGCALLGAWLAAGQIDRYYPNRGYYDNIRQLEQNLVLIALGVFAGALLLAFVFTYQRSRKHQVPVWSATTRRLLVNTLLPMAAGGFVILRMLQLNDYVLIAPCCLVFYGLGLVNGSKYTLGEIRYLGYLVFYGLGLVNGSKYTLGEIRYLGYAEILLGIINLWVFGMGLLFWALGFGVLHIVYGAVMWWKYERQQA